MNARRRPGISPENVHWLEDELEQNLESFFDTLADDPDNVVWPREIHPHTFRLMAKAAVAVLEAQQV